ncbi:MAG: ribonuclease HII [candidate division WOR-3 bacterium]|nr:MAG: ribonuclease HII [candidate division WOR-3 bacterium]
MPRKKQVKALPDQRLWKKYSLVAGVDEAGRGPLAGPVVAAAVVLPRDYLHTEIDDSKKLSSAKRDVLYKIITAEAVAYSFGVVDAETIDVINILEATKRAMRAAIAGLRPVPQFILIDGHPIGDLDIRSQALVKGDTKSISVAAASILAKVYRDRIMCEYHKCYPQYDFNRHKGYPTRLHRDRIHKYGSCPIHRKSFRLL